MTADELLALYQSPDSVPPLSALHGLDEVNWAMVRDAYGPATSVPAMLRALVSPNAKHRQFACCWACETLWHQGNVFSASAAVIPFLYKLLEEDGLQDKEYIAVLLATIAEGEPPFLNCATDAAKAAEWRAIFAKINESLDEKISEARAIAAEIQRQLTRRPDLLSRCIEISASDEPKWTD